jgi:hypothetical protein
MQRLIFAIAAISMAALLMGGLAFGATMLFPYLRLMADDRFVPVCLVSVAALLLVSGAIRRKYRANEETDRAP